jgi:hypothetical protein
MSTGLLECEDFLLLIKVINAHSLRLETDGRKEIKKATFAKLQTSTK